MVCIVYSPSITVFLFMAQCLMTLIKNEEFIKVAVLDLRQQIN